MRSSFLRYAANACPPSFKAKELTKTLVKNPPPLPPMKGVKFGTLFTPHMLIIDYADGAWGKPRIEPFHNFSMAPQSSVFHYGTSCFEGMKAYADIADIEKVAKGETLADTTRRVRLFRPEMNIARLRSSMQRICFPAFDEAELNVLMKEFVRVEQNYVPPQFGYSMYLRPTAIGTQETLGVAPSHNVRLYVIASPVGPYYPPTEGGRSTTKPVRLLAEEKYKRAWPGGTGGLKLGANYAGPLLAQVEAHAKGYDQVLWLGANNEVQEAGAMNFCVIWKTKEGRAELITAPLDGTILPGVTRDSILSLARQWGEFDVSERAYSIEELVQAVEEGRVIECFGCGTAAIVFPVCALSFRGKEYAVPCPEDSFTNRFLNEMLNIQYGNTSSEWSVLV